MGTDWAPFLANLFLFAYKYNWFSKLFDKRDVFGFLVVNYPELSSGNIPNQQSYGVFVSGFRRNKLRHVFEKFASNYYELLIK